MMGRLIWTVTALLLSASHAYAGVPEPPVTVPEPATLGLLAVGLAGAAWWGKRRR